LVFEQDADEAFGFGSNWAQVHHAERAQKQYFTTDGPQGMKKDSVVISPNILI